MLFVGREHYSLATDDRWTHWDTKMKAFIPLICFTDLKDTRVACSDMCKWMVLARVMERKVQCLVQELMDRNFVCWMVEELVTEVEALVLTWEALTVTRRLRMGGTRSMF